MNTQAVSKIQNEFQDRDSLISALNQLEPVCADLLSHMVLKETPASDIQLARRDLLKAHTALTDLTTEMETLLGLDFLTQAEAAAVQEVVQVRQLATADYHRAVKLENNLARAAREFAPKLNATLLSKLTGLQGQVKVIRQGLFALYWALPDLGMTFSEWNGMSVLQRREMRPAGRPALPLEARISNAQADVDRLLMDVKVLSSGAIKNLEEALAGVKLSNRGRPAVSPIGKLERQVGRHKRELERLNPADFPTAAEHEQNPRIGDTYQMRAERIRGRIDEVMATIRELEEDLEGVAVYRRQLEKLRARHRDLALLEPQVKGAEQAKVLLEILLNEEKQQGMIETIHRMDSSATEANTHKVNPKETRDRIKRLEMNGRLADSELLVLSEIKRTMNECRTIRSR
ncbi:hypothetical protein IFT48_03375 [Pseudomonas fluorescens]|uniref:hypothetical protein n=1 Tax=Pseudomonas TaxID=286 RepID=UPI000F0393B3|nr:MULTISPECIES: hypothetical protein [Pseudomonas]MBD8089010.1 hypothetical protein [Pseudomonas fluorescens]MBD8615558.1 hypothetical protein [Pseudomonas putida]MBD8681790.1 hypothetical protein [Pseudomonas sp. CFBP 13719]